MTEPHGKSVRKETHFSNHLFVETSKCRRTMVLVVFTGFMLHHILRVNISIAIVDMVSTQNSSSKITRFDWTEEQKHNVIGSFFWSYGIISIIAGHLSEIYGTKKIMGGGVLLATACTMLTPLAAYLHYYCLVLARSGVGLGLGLQWSSIMPIAVKWIAPNNFSKFFSNMMASQLGAALSLLLCGYLIDAFGWPSVFYCTGAIGFIWCATLYYFVFDSPELHPRISQMEKEAILKKTQQKLKIVKFKDKPWFKIFTSLPIWAIIIANCALMLQVNFFANYIPLFIDRILYFNIKNNGIWGSIPFIVSYGAGLLGCYLADKWRKSKQFSLINIRKLFTSLSLWIPILSLLIESFWGYLSFVSMPVFIFWQASLAFAVAGHISNAVDLSPAYSGTIHGLATGFGGLAGYVSTQLVGLVLEHEHEFQEWSILFWILIGVSFIGWTFYIIFGKADVQEWSSTTKNEDLSANDKLVKMHDEA